MKIYHVETQEDYDALMIELEEKRYKWLSGRKPTDFNYWKSMKEYNYIKISDKYITIGCLEQLKKRYPDILIIEYKAKGDNEMANKECNQCHKKWHQDSAKYCSWCGNKLVSEPKFKVGDYVTDTSDDDPFICKIEEFEGNGILGRWYCVSKKYFDKLLLLPASVSRLSTPEEIAEYESALTFHEHGRKPFEVKKGDIISDSESDNFFVTYEDIELVLFDKEDFTSGDYTLVKTAEEVNEWLENK